MSEATEQLSISVDYFGDTVLMYTLKKKNKKKEKQLLTLNIALRKGKKNHSAL